MATTTSRARDEWIRPSLRTPGILIFGMVLSPCGWVLDLASTVAPNWRTLHNLPNSASGFSVLQGVWDICTTSSPTSAEFDCGKEDSAYFGHQLIEIARGLMVASLVVTLVGIAVAIPGVRCWRNNSAPNWTLAGLGGLLIFCSGVMTIIPVAWYTNILESVTAVPPSVSVQVGYCIILGYIGGIMEVLAGFVMFIGICRCCGGKNRGEVRVERDDFHTERRREPPRRQDRPRSEASSVVYSKDYEDVSLPRAKSAAPSFNTVVSSSSKPYDADL